MGACSFGQIQVGKYKNHNEAYRDAVEDAIDYYGHQEGYNGTISTTDHPRLKTDNPRFGTKAFRKWEDNLMEKMNKRDCVCVEVKGKMLQDMKKKRGLVGKRGVKAYYFFGYAAE